jgi:ribokinase
MFDIITIGTATRDVFLRSTLFKTLKDPKHLEKLGFKTGEAECFALGSKLEIEKPVFAVGGGAANAAVTFARQGWKTATVVKIGDDLLGNDVLRELKEEKITVFASVDKKEGTAYSTILLTPQGERTILVYRGATSDLERKEVPFKKLSAKWAYIAPGNINPILMEEIITQLKRGGAKIAMNPSKYYITLGAEKLKGVLKWLDVVIMNREEASYFTGVKYEKEHRIFKKFDALIDGIAVMTEGPKGAKVSDGSYLYTAGIFKDKKIADRTGAGDAFGSGFVAGLMEKNDIHHALRIAAANSTSVVETIGAEAGILRKKDLNQNRFKYLELDVEPL